MPSPTTKNVLDTTFRVGGPPDEVVRFTSSTEYREARPLLGEHRVIGGGSNLLVSDDGPAGTIAVLSSASSGVLDIDASRVRLDAAGSWHRTAVELGRHGLAGVESLVGIPGTVGGAAVQNLGAYGHEFCEVVERVRVLSTTDGSTRWLSRAECRFGYRNSRFKSTDRGRFVILEVEAQLRPDEGHVPVYAELASALREQTGSVAASYPLPEVHAAVIDLRARKNMIWSEDDTRTWGAGSFFVNPLVSAASLDRCSDVAGCVPPHWAVSDGLHKLSAGWLVEQAGFRRGHEWDLVGLADGHALGLVNVSGRASCADVIDAANAIAAGVTRTFDIRLLAEPILLGFPSHTRLEFDAHLEP